MAIVNYFAAARAAAGVTESEILASTLGEVISAASSRYPQLVAILPGCSYLVNGSSQSDLSIEISADDVIDVLPRFAGGA
jgi:molybdopterin converting factor small subunit